MRYIFIVTAEESCKTLVVFVYTNIETDILIMCTYLCTLILAFAPNIKHISAIIGYNIKYHVNYVIWIFQHILDNVSYLGAAICVPADKS